MAARRPRTLGRFLTAGVVAIMLLAWAAWTLAGERATSTLAKQARITASLHSAVLRADVERYRSLSFVLGRDGEVRSVLAHPTPAGRDALNRKLEMLSRETRIDVLYILNARGVAAAASNWRSAVPFCQTPAAAEPPPSTRRRGCSDRWYFRGAMQNGSAAMFALGRADAHPGLYTSHAVDDGARRLGVAVAKVQFDDLEAHWRAAGDPTFVTDSDGVVLITSIPTWRLQTLGPLRREVVARLMSSHQFGDAPLKPLPAAGFVHPPGAVAVIRANLPGRRPGETFVETTTALPELGWTLHTMKPASKAIGEARITAASITLLAGVLGLTFAVLFWQRRARRRLEADREAAAREELEVRVAQRTSALSTANRKLMAEIEERRRVEGRVHRLMDELAQANRLATLGQIAAGVAHEINQPLAAIRTYAENAAAFVTRGDSARAASNLTTIGGLTERIAVITDELRAFARRGSAQTGPVSVAEAISGALLLVSHRLARQGVSLIRAGDDPGLLVLADQVRLEQVLVNLLQNALDALEDTPDPEIRLAVRPSRRLVHIVVQDNGPGLPPGAAQALFMPFNTSKAQGLGLGLVISRDIMRELGGDLSARPAKQGARFDISLRRVSTTEAAGVAPVE